MNQSLSLGEASFFKDFFSSLTESGTEYCVLRNYEGLPTSARGGDIDIAVLPSNRDQVAQIIQDVAAQYGGELVVDYIGSGRFLRILGRYQGEWWGVALDLFSCIEYRGIEYIGCQKIIDRGRNHGSIRIADDEDSVIIALVKELISNGKPRKNYLPEAREIWSNRGSQCVEILNGFLSDDTLNRLINLLKGRGVNFTPLVNSLRHDVLKQGNLKHRMTNLWTRMRRLWNTPGISIAVMGTDGAGKTTVIESIRPVLEQALHSKIHYEHLRPNWIPKLGKVAGKQDTGEVVVKPHGQKPSGIVGSMIRLVYYAVDYYVGYWVKIHSKLARSPSITVFDRYCYDFILDPLRMRIGLPPWLIKFVMLGAPRPRLILCLGADPEVIFKRKPETSLKEVRRQVLALQEMCGGNSRAIWVDTSSGVQNSCDTALRAIQQAMLRL